MWVIRIFLHCKLYKILNFINTLLFLEVTLHIEKIMKYDQSCISVSYFITSVAIIILKLNFSATRSPVLYYILDIAITDIKKLIFKLSSLLNQHVSSRYTTQIIIRKMIQLFVFQQKAKHWPMLMILWPKQTLIIPTFQWIPKCFHFKIDIIGVQNFAKLMYH